MPRPCAEPCLPPRLYATIWVNISRKTLCRFDLYQHAPDKVPQRTKTRVQPACYSHLRRAKVCAPLGRASPAGIFQAGTPCSRLRVILPPEREDRETPVKLSDALEVLLRFGALMLRTGNTAIRTREWIGVLAG